jgi:RNA polymerase sigma factor for flagellar operon FliA
MVHKIARQVVTYLKPPLSFEDMVSAGTVGLVRAARDFDPSHQAEFKTYAYIRIRGAEQTGTTPADNELAERLGITVDELYETFENARAQHFLSLDDSSDESPALGCLLAAPHSSLPDERIEKAELVEKLAEAIEQLQDKQRQVVLLYYQQQLTMKQIAEILEITESRVSQLHASALFSLSTKLRQWKDGRL